MDHRLKIAAITGKQATRLPNNPETYQDLWCTIMGISTKLYFRNPEKIPVESATDNYGRIVVCAKCGDKTGLTSVIGLTRRAKLQCHLPTKARRSPQQPGKILTSNNKLNS
jgi:hypothetical protein